MRYDLYLPATGWTTLGAPDCWGTTRVGCDWIGWPGALVKPGPGWYTGGGWFRWEGGGKKPTWGASAAPVAWSLWYGLYGGGRSNVESSPYFGGFLSMLNERMI